MNEHNNDAMNAQERRATAGLSLVFAFRMLGMFMVLPVLATYGQALSGATPFLLGLAIGAYGLTQALLQIPFGMLSDRFGRLPVIYIGLLIFAAAAWWLVYLIRCGAHLLDASYKVLVLFLQP